MQFAEPRLTRALTNAVTAAKTEAGTLDELAVLIGEGRIDDAVTRAVNAGVIAASEAHAAIYVDTGLNTAAFLGEELGVTVGIQSGEYAGGEVHPKPALRFDPGMERVSADRVPNRPDGWHSARLESD